MILNGLQKLTLLDYPGHVACTVFTGGCNFRCPFCHNALLVTHVGDADVVDENEFFDMLKKRKGIIDGVCITGGEPLLQRDIEDFIRKIRDIGYAVKLDTNGSFPDKLRRIIDEGLVDYVAMDIKNTPEKYGATIGIDDFDVSPILESVKILKEGRVPYEFRTTVIDGFHEPEDFDVIAGWLDGADRYFLQAFKDSGDLIDGAGLSACDKKVMESMLSKVSGHIRETGLRGV